MKIKHPFKPIYDEHSKVLILGSLPSVKSREVNFYYGHPKNRFWSTLAKVYNEPTLTTIKEKENFLFRHKIALFDCIKSCTIEGSSDSTIKDVIPNDLTPILANSNIEAIFTLGKKAYTLYNKYLYPQTNIKAIYLPSTSPANCHKGIEEELVIKFKQIKEFTD